MYSNDLILNNEYTRSQAAQQTGQIFGVYMSQYDRETDAPTMVYYKPDADQLRSREAYYFVIAEGKNFYPLPAIDQLPRELRAAAYRDMYRTGLKPTQCTAIINALNGEGA